VLELSDAEARDLYGRIVRALQGLPPDVLREVRAAAVHSHVRTTYPPPPARRRVFCAYFDAAARRVDMRARLVAQLPAAAVAPLVAQACAHAMLWLRGGDWESGAAADALARSWGFDLAPPGRVVRGLPPRRG
jgi:hypothetical protein